MDRLTETSLKVNKIESRLDDYLQNAEMKTVELRKELNGDPVGSLEHFYLVGSYNLNLAGGRVVLHGVMNFVGPNSGNSVIKVTVKVDGYVVLVENVNLSCLENRTISLMRALPVGTTSEKIIEVVTHLVSGEACKFLGWDYFLWGQGLVVLSGEYLSSGKVNAASGEGDLMVYLTHNGRGYYYYGVENLTDFSVEKMVDFGKVNHLDGDKIIEKIAVENNQGEIETLKKVTYYSFVVNSKRELRCYMGTSLSEVHPGVLVKDVSGVSACSIDDGTKILVAYCVGASLYYFCVTQSSVTESVLLTTFDDVIDDVSLVKDCSSTQVLLVSLKGGNNYMFFSVTGILKGLMESSVWASMELSFY